MKGIKRSIKVTYTITLKDVKKACFEAVKIVPFLKKRRIIFSLTFPFIALVFPLLFPFLSWMQMFIIIPILIIYFYLYGYALRIYTTVKTISYKKSPKNIPMVIELEKENLIVEQEFTKQKFTADSFLYITQQLKYLNNLSEIADLILIFHHRASKMSIL